MWRYDNFFLFLFTFSRNSICQTLLTIIYHIVIQNTALCAGKRSIADYLVNEQGFSILYLEPVPSTPPSAPSLHDETHPGAQSSVSSSSSASHGEEVNGVAEPRSFATAGELLAFVTKRWQRRWVTIDVRDDEFLEKHFQRPWFLLVSVDAPVMVRWQRFQERQVDFLLTVSTPWPDGFLSDANPYVKARALWISLSVNVILISMILPEA